ncbi:MAG: glycine C-acetyltransferase [Candidatus Taylorbacteria bacterium RIFCSPHIGHO2_01_FULL_51_15]|uniref:8-amino-7-oxononanoate synthase n=1 Tax=Candidatus Taylorbacteria bacterium RIFCSPHIGHO2_01_FULL_51_15 TaxID=1802304 RepID=A0A1G2MCW5_9BACT|nr:MAG: glycine C-acetyltransferase [Candidatus Taylorbacteria bacterium RIFCSPHIGHO2_01_FULL_51_15]
MFSNKLKTDIQNELQTMREGGLFKVEKVVEGHPGTEIIVDGKKLINLCANNYLGTSQQKGVLKAAQKALKEYSLGLNSVRFIAGTTDLHKKLETAISKFFQTEDTILYTSCFDANTGLFEVLLTEGDAIFSDELNHASIIDGVRLCKAERFRFHHNNLEELEKQLIAAKGARRRLVVTDGVFSMDGEIAKLDELKALCDKHDAIFVVDDSHGSGVLGKTGRGSIEEKGVLGKVDILTSTFGKALGGAGGGFTTGKKEIIDLLRQRSRTYLFSNSLMPAIAGAALYVIEHFEQEFIPLKERLTDNTRYFRTKLEKLGYTLGGGSHPITPLMIFDEVKTMALADALLEEGIYTRGFAYPVVPKGKGRIRIQISAAHTKEQLDTATTALERAGKKLNII